MHLRDYALLLLLAAIWGLSFVFYRVAVPSLGAGLFAELRVAIAAGALLLYLAATGTGRATLGRIRSTGRSYLLVGGFNAALPFALIGASELVLPASYASVLNATMPLFSVALAARFLAQRVTALQTVGVAVGILGVAIVVEAAPFPLTLPVLLAVAASTSAAASYAIAAVYIRARMPRVASLDLTVGQQVAAALWLLPLAAVNLPGARFPAVAIGAAITIALLCTVLAYLVYFNLLQRVGATHASTVTFVTPVFGVLWGNLLLGEPVGWGLLAGFGLVLVGVGLVTGLRWGRGRPGARPGPGR